MFDFYDMLFIFSFFIAIPAIIYTFVAVTKDLFKMRRNINNSITEYQRKLIKMHIDEVENIYQQMRRWRHDYHNHIQTMKAFLASDADTSVEHIEYLGKLDADLISVDTVVKTGNVIADAMLNSKLSLAASKNINIDVKAAPLPKFKISEIELCVIIGNMLDNSIEACVKLPNESDRFIKIDISTHKSMFYISVLNSTDGKANKQGVRYISTKDFPLRGFGLMSIDRIVAKYGGFVNRRNESGVFTTEIMFPI
jgi:sensor histidine kinase regulating citrate/malate metabolism